MKVHRFTDEMMGSNIYLLQSAEPGQAVLIDTGTGYNAWETLKAVGEKIPLERIKKIVLTHMHFDHTGGAQTFAQATGATVLISERDGEFIRKKDKKSTAYENIFSEMPDIELNYVGDVIDLGEAELRVIETPGHTIGSICLYEPEEKLLFTGDTVFANGIGRFDLPTGNREMLKSSIEKLSELEVRIIYPGHGDTIGGEPEDVGAFLRELANVL